MNQQDFDKLFQSTVSAMTTLIAVKGGEYAGSDDRLANFKRGAALTGATPLQVAFVYASKHYDAIATYVRDEAASIDRPRTETINGRLLDLLNYLIFMKALIAEQRGSGHRANEFNGPNYAAEQTVSVKDAFAALERD